MDRASTGSVSAAALDFAAHDFADFAQEFLRRNQAYRDGYARVMMTPATSQPWASEGLARQWGLCFPLRS